MDIPMLGLMGVLYWFQLLSDVVKASAVLLLSVARLTVLACFLAVCCILTVRLRNC